MKSILDTLEVLKLLFLSFFGALNLIINPQLCVCVLLPFFLKTTGPIAMKLGIGPKVIISQVLEHFGVPALPGVAAGAHFVPFLV